MVQQARYPFNPSDASPNFWAPEKTPIDPLHAFSGLNRFNDTTGIRRPPISLETALRDHCGIPGAAYFVVAIGHDGKPTVFTTTQTTIDLASYCDIDKLSHDVIKAQTDKSPSTQAPTHPRFPKTPLSEAPLRAENGKRQGHHIVRGSFQEDGPFVKRARADTARPSEREEQTISTSKPKRPITISNDADVWKYYEDCFKKCQQTACKLIAKAWVKVVEPKKQSTHPYTGKDEKAPAWWPKPWGTNHDQKVRHKEPDHLLKHERLYLLCHILRLIVEPNKEQHPSIQKLNLNVAALEEATNEALSSWFTSKESPTNATKRPFLKEIFRMARQEERFKANEIDPNVKVFVRDDGNSHGNLSDPDDASVCRDEEEQTDPTPNSSRASPSRILPTQNHEVGSTNHLQAHDYDHDHFSQNLIESNFSSDRPNYVDTTQSVGHGPLQSGNVGMPEMYPNPHDSSRRGSLFPPQGPDYHQSPATPIFPQWPAATTATADQGVPSFSPSTAAAVNSSSFTANHGLNMLPPGQPYFSGGSSEALSRGFTEGPQTDHLLRPGQMGPATFSSAPGYPNYMHHEAGNIPGPAYKYEGFPRHPF